MSTSGNAGNVAYALMAAKAVGATALALTGHDGRKIAKLADCYLIAPKEKPTGFKRFISLFIVSCTLISNRKFSLSIGQGIRES